MVVDAGLINNNAPKITAAIPWINTTHQGKAGLSCVMVPEVIVSSPSQ
jgi:hypothetical protein